MATRRLRDRRTGGPGKGAGTAGVGRAVSVTETAIYIAVAVVIASLSAVVMVSLVGEFVAGLGRDELRETSVQLLNNVLLVLMLVEILHTVGISIREHVLVPEPFLIVGLIAAIRRVLVLTAEQGIPSADTAASFRLIMIELGILTVLSVGFVGALVLLARARRHYGPVTGVAEPDEPQGRDGADRRA